MSGHSKWANIKRKKEAEDAKRSKLFAKLVRDIMVAAKVGGADVATNPKLKSAIQKAKENNVPKHKIDLAIDKGAGRLKGANMQEAVYEGYGPGGVAIMMNVLTDNKNRTVSEIRSVFNRAGGALGEAGSVSYIFSGNPPSPSFKVPLSGQSLKTFNELISMLKANEDIVDVIHNADIQET